MGADAAKAVLRRRVRVALAGEPATARARADAALAARLLARPEVLAADALFCYRSRPPEADTAPVFSWAWAHGVPIAAPRCDAGTRSMAWFAVASDDDFAPGAYGIGEPAADPARRMRPVDFARPVAIVPGLAFDRAGRRFGQGGGYYDRFLPGFPGISIGLARSPYLLPDLAALGAIGPHDVPVDLVVTD